MSPTPLSIPRTKREAAWAEVGVDLEPPRATFYCGVATHPGPGALSRPRPTRRVMALEGTGQENHVLISSWWVTTAARTPSTTRSSSAAAGDDLRFCEKA